MSGSGFRIVPRPSGVRTIVLVACTAFLAAPSLRAGDTTDPKAAAGTAATAEAEPDSKNWIELGIGGIITHGDNAQFEQEHRMAGDVFGGIQDMHYEQTVGKSAQLTVDGHAIWDNNDYDIKVDLSQPNLGYIRGGFTEFRSWYDGNGGFFPHNGQSFPPPFPEMHIDRGEAWVELGLRLPDWPEITIHYAHEFRDGQKDSIIWGDTTLTGLKFNNPRKIAPAYHDIDETRDIFALDAMKNFGNTDVGIGMRFEHDNNDDSLQLERGAGQLPPVVASPGAQRFITQDEKNKVDMFSGHGTTETRFSDTLWFTAAYSYTALGGDISGTRIIGTGYNSSYSDPILTLQSNDHGFLNLAGSSQVDDHVVNVNLLWMPLKNLSLIAAFRYTHEDRDSDSTFLDTTTVANVAPFTPSNPQGGFHRAAVPVMRSANTSEDFNNFAERMELRYAAIKNWLFYAEGDWEEECGRVFENEVVGIVNQGALNKDTSLLVQKYTVGANWYPLEGLSASAQYFHKVAAYDNSYDSELAVPPVAGSERNQRLIGQDWTTDDANVRVTWRPKIPAKLGTIAFVSRYDFVQALISGKWAVSPGQSGTITAPPTPGTNTFFDSEHTALITNHVITESVTWNPMARLYLQGDLSYVLDQTNTPVTGRILNGSAATATYTSATFQDFRNDYWTVTGGAGYVLDDKTDLRADYTFYRANDYLNNDKVALPYGMGATEYTVSATATRQLSKSMRLIVKYSYVHYVDQPSGGNNDYEAHSIYTGLQIRF
jgi:hypothetical protein